MKRTVMAAALLAVMTGPALAGHGPRDIAAIDEALAAGTNLTEAQLAQVADWRDQGAQMHQNGQHGDSVNLLHQAMEMLGLEHE